MRNMQETEHISVHRLTKDFCEYLDNNIVPIVSMFPLYSHLSVTTAEIGDYLDQHFNRFGDFFLAYNHTQVLKRLFAGIGVIFADVYKYWKNKHGWTDGEKAIITLHLTAIREFYRSIYLNNYTSVHNLIGKEHLATTLPIPNIVDKEDKDYENISNVVIHNEIDMGIIDARAWGEKHKRPVPLYAVVDYKLREDLITLFRNSLEGYIFFTSKQFTYIDRNGKSYDVQTRLNRKNGALTLDMISVSALPIPAVYEFSVSPSNAPLLKQMLLNLVKAKQTTDNAERIELYNETIDIFRDNILPQWQIKQLNYPDEYLLSKYIDTLKQKDFLFYKAMRYPHEKHVPPLTEEVMYKFLFDGMQFLKNINFPYLAWAGLEYLTSFGIKINENLLSHPVYTKLRNNYYREIKYLIETIAINQQTATKIHTNNSAQIHKGRRKL